MTRHVIPAKAGIHRRSAWIPAFAGMTCIFAGMTCIFAGMTCMLRSHPFC